MVRPVPESQRSSFAFAAMLWVSVLGLALLGPDRSTLAAALVAYSVGFAGLAGLWSTRSPIVSDPRRMLALALVLRVTMFPALPDLSDDLYRYIWDGWLTASGVNPFRFAPSDDALTAFQDSGLFGALNSPEYHSIYPPFSQIAFAAAGLAYRSGGFLEAAYLLKAIFAAMEAGGLLLMTAAAARFGLGARHVALYALNPLVLVTLSGGGHSESGMILGMGLVAWALSTGRGALAWIGLALATAAKGIPLLFAPLVLRHQAFKTGSWGRSVATALPAAALGVALLLPFYFDGFFAAVGSSADLYVRSFEFNAGLYRVLEWIGFALTGADHGRILGPALRLAFLAGAVWVWMRWPVPDGRAVLGGCLTIVGIYLVTATTVHPWYLTWGLVLVPFAAGMRRAWLFASWAAFTTYFVYVGTPEWIPGALFWGGVATLVVADGEPVLRDYLLRLAGRRKARQIAPFLEGDRLLDLGAAEGYVSAALEGSGVCCVLLDIGPFARVDLPSAVYDGTNVPFEDDAFDTVFISLALHHAADPERVVAEAARVSRGRLVVTESTYTWEWERRLLSMVDGFANRLRAHAMSGAHESDSPAFRTVPRWEDTFRGLGLEVILSERLNRIGHKHHVFVLVPRAADSERDSKSSRVESE